MITKNLIELVVERLKIKYVEGELRNILNIAHDIELQQYRIKYKQGPSIPMEYKRKIFDICDKMTNIPVGESVEIEKKYTQSVRYNLKRLNIKHRIVTINNKKIMIIKQ